MHINRYIVIMAGGRGERFWPMSREKRPKQLIALLGERSFLQQAFDNTRPLVPIENFFVITNAAQAAEVRRQLPELPKENVVAEPVGRDTCAAVALGAAIVGRRETDAVMAVLPADHVIPEGDKFRQVLCDSMSLALREPVIVTIGIKPSEPATGYGYIQSGPDWPQPEGIPPYFTKFYKAERFVEKPNLEKAVEYVQSGQYRWNAGMFVWSYNTILAGLRQNQPEMADACQRWTAIPSAAKLAKTLAVEYPAIKKISIDYALMEKANNVVIADGSFIWDDLGSWPALARHLKADASGNCAVADLIQVDSSNNIIFDARKKKRTPIALVGITDSILVQTDDAVLFAHKSQAQKIKELVKKLAEDPRFKPLI